MFCNQPLRFQPYLNVLPKGEGLDNTLFYSDEELKMCEWPLVIEETQERLRKLQETHAEMKMGFEGCSWEDLLWGVYQVESRVFTIYEDKPTVYEDVNRKDYSGGKIGSDPFNRNPFTRNPFTRNPFTRNPFTLNPSP